MDPPVIHFFSVDHLTNVVKKRQQDGYLPLNKNKTPEKFRGLEVYNC